MEWPTRGTGRSYDSLSGFAALIGYFSNKILSYVGLNRKCNKCDHGHSAEHPGCRKNFIGSAKAMEPRAAAILATENNILKECNMQWAIPICDNDSGIISALKNVSNHEIVKHADNNHTTGGLVKKLYKLKQAHQKIPIIKSLTLKQLNI